MAQIVCPVVPAEDRARLAAIVADRDHAQKQGARARIILHSADRLNVAEARRVGIGHAEPAGAATHCTGRAMARGRRDLAAPGEAHPDRTRRADQILAKVNRLIAPVHQLHDPGE